MNTDPYSNHQIRFVRRLPTSGHALFGPYNVAPVPHPGDRAVMIVVAALFVVAIVVQVLEVLP